MDDPLRVKLWWIGNDAVLVLILIVMDDPLRGEIVNLFR